jgi:hypothetical protein
MSFPLQSGNKTVPLHVATGVLHNLAPAAADCVLLPLPLLKLFVRGP